MWKWAAGGAGVLALGGCLIGVYAFGPKDDELIYQALSDSIEASREGRPFGVLEKLASNFTYNGEPMTNRAEVARVIRELKPNITVPGRTLRISGGEATLVSPAEVAFGEGGLMKLKEVEITFQRGTGTRWVIFPYSRWRVQSVKSEGFDPTTMMGPLSPF